MQKKITSKVINKILQDAIRFDIIDSTNTYLKANYEELNELTLITAKHQTAGRGRRDHSWIDGEDLLFSFLIKDYFKKEDLPKLSLITSVAVHKALSKYVHVKIKWPNDIIVFLENGLKKRKLAGILIESVIKANKVKAIIIGIGINVNTTQYPDELFDIATSLKLETNISYDLTILRDEVLIELCKMLELYQENDKTYLESYRNNFPLIGEIVDFEREDEVFQAKVINVLENGNIILEVDGRIKEYSSGEIRLKNYLLL